MPEPLRLGILQTHPVQYLSPLYRTLAARSDVDLTVFFAHRPNAVEQGTGFGVPFEWDVDLTGGYRSEWLTNVAAKPSASAFMGCDTPEIAGIVARRRFDAFVVMGWHARSYWQAMAGCWRAGVPVMVRGDSQLTTEPGAKRAVKRVVYPLFVRRLAACLSVGERSDAYFRYYGARRVVRTPHFVDNDFLGRRALELAPERSALRARWGIPDGALVLAFVGKHIPIKRPVDLVRGIAASGRRDVWALYVGDGELRRACEDEAERLGVNARFAGFMNQTQLPEAYAAADVLVLPSQSETWGLVVNEAMASGRPALVSEAVGSAPDLVHDGATGYRFAVGDVEALGRHIARLADDRTMVERMGGHARTLVAEYSVDAAADGIVHAAASAAEAA